MPFLYSAVILFDMYLPLSTKVQHDDYVKLLSNLTLRLLNEETLHIPDVKKPSSYPLFVLHVAAKDKLCATV